METAQTYLDAARWFHGLVGRIPDAAWSEPGLGVWTVRDLVGHTSRAIVTVITYLDRPAEREEVPSAAAYYALTKDAAADSDAVAERGREAGRRLGEDPAARIGELVVQVSGLLDRADDPLIETFAGGMRLRSYLPTRTFELAVHGLDVAAAVGLEPDPPADVLRDVSALAGRIAVELGQGLPVLAALTGRGRYPEGFSVV